MTIDQYIFTQFMELPIEFYILIDEYFDWMLKLLNTLFRNA